MFLPKKTKQPNQTIPLNHLWNVPVICEGRTLWSYKAFAFLHAEFETLSDLGKVWCSHWHSLNGCKGAPELDHSAAMLSFLAHFPLALPKLPFWSTGAGALGQGDCATGFSSAMLPSCLWREHIGACMGIIHAAQDPEIILTFYCGIKKTSVLVLGGFIFFLTLKFQSLKSISFCSALPSSTGMAQNASSVTAAASLVPVCHGLSPASNAEPGSRSLTAHCPHTLPLGGMGRRMETM